MTRVWPVAQEQMPVAELKYPWLAQMHAVPALFRDEPEGQLHWPFAKIAPGALHKQFVPPSFGALKGRQLHAVPAVLIV